MESTMQRSRGTPFQAQGASEDWIGNNFGMFIGQKGQYDYGRMRERGNNKLNELTRNQIVHGLLEHGKFINQFRVLQVTIRGF